MRRTRRVDGTSQRGVTHDRWNERDQNSRRCDSHLSAHAPNVFRALQQKGGDPARRSKTIRRSMKRLTRLRLIAYRRLTKNTILGALPAHPSLARPRRNPTRDQFSVLMAPARPASSGRRLFTGLCRYRGARFVRCERTQTLAVVGGRDPQERGSFFGERMPSRKQSMHSEFLLRAEK
jgi:hypothetical protein